MTRIKTFPHRDYIKANGRASRLAEVENHTRLVSIAGVYKSKKVYDRKRNKAEMERALSYLFFIGFRECLQDMFRFCNMHLYYTLSGVLFVKIYGFIPERL